MADVQSQIKATVVYDTSGLKQGVNETNEAMQSMVDQAAVTATGVMTKTQAIAASFRAQGKEATDAAIKEAEAAKISAEASAQKAYAMKRARAEGKDYTDSIYVMAVIEGQRKAETEAATAAIRAQTEALRLQEIQQRRDYEQWLAIGAAEAALVAPAHSAVTEIQATSAAVRSFEGNPGIRSMEVFVGKTLGLGPLMKNLFPLVGAAAFGTIILDGIEKLEALRVKTLGASAAITEAFGEMHDKAQISNDDLQITSDKLQDEIDKLSGNPGNGLQTALDEGIKRADQLLVSLRADRKELAALFKENSVGVFGGVLFGVAPTGKQEKEILADNKALMASTRTLNEDYVAELRQSKTPDEQRAAGERHAQAIRAAFQAQIDTYHKESERLKAEQEANRTRVERSMTTGAAVPIRGVDNSAKIDNIQGVIDELRDRVTAMDLSEAIVGQQEKVGGLKQGKGDKEAANKAAELELKGMEAHVASMRLNGNASDKAIFDYWAGQISAFREGSAQYNAIVEKQASIAVADATKAAEAIKRFKGRETRDSSADVSEEERVARSIAAVGKTVTEQGEDITRTGERWAGYNASAARSSEIAANINATMAEAQIRLREQAGGLTVLGAAQATARVHADEHAKAVHALRLELELLEAVGAGLKPGDKGYEQNQAKQQDLKNQIAQEEGKGQQQGQTDLAAVSAAIAKPYLNAFNDINNGWLKVQADLIQGNGNISRAFAHMGLELVQTSARAAEQILANEVRSAIRRAAANQAMVAQKVSTDAAGAAAGAAISKGTTAAQGLDAAKLAAKYTYAQVSNWPVIGPFVAPVFAAGAFAAVAAFRDGGIVAGSQEMAVPILAHGGERVLTATQTNNFERLVNNTTSGGGGGDVNVHVGGNNFASSGGDLPSQLAAHERHLVRMIHRLHREGKLSFAR